MTGTEVAGVLVVVGWAGISMTLLLNAIHSWRRYRRGS